MAAKKIVYKNELEYKEALEEILVLMNKGEGNLSTAELKKLRSMAVAAEVYEEIHYPFPTPKTIPAMIERKMSELKLTQELLADRLGMDKPKLLKILDGKTPPDVAFLKAAYKVLNIDPAFLLEKA